MKRRRLLLLLLGILVIAILTLPAFGQSQVRIVRLSYVNGAVQIDRGTGHGLESAIMNMPITQGARLQTRNGQAEIEFENGSTVRLTPETTVSFDTLSLLPSGDKVSNIHLLRGVAYFDLDHKDHNEFLVQAGGRELQVKKSARFRIDAKRDQVRIAVTKGEITSAASGTIVAIHKKQTLSFDPAEQTQYALAKNVDEYQFDSWDADRRAYNVQYARVVYPGGGAPYYGWDDLSYYGQFGYVSGYGQVWRPYGVGYGWDPFAVGYWVSYPFGYTWVSPYAWGWIPYRYGGWHFIPGIGWCWRPGGWNGWNTMAPVINAPPAWRPPTPPQGPGGGVIVVGHPHPAPTGRDIVSWFDGGRTNHHAVPLPTPNVGTPAPVMGVNTMATTPGSIRTTQNDHPRPTHSQGVLTATPSGAPSGQRTGGGGRPDRITVTPSTPPGGGHATGGHVGPPAGGSPAGHSGAGMSGGARSGGGGSVGGGSAMGGPSAGGSGAVNGGGGAGGAGGGRGR